MQSNSRWLFKVHTLDETIEGQLLRLMESPLVKHFIVSREIGTETRSIVLEGFIEFKKKYYPNFIGSQIHGIEFRQASARFTSEMYLQYHLLDPMNVSRTYCK